MKKQMLILFSCAALMSSSAMAADIQATAGATPTAAPAAASSAPVRHDMKDYAITDASSYTLAKSIVVNGQKLNSQPLLINGCVLVPARAVSDALGFTTTWFGGAEPYITIASGSMQTQLYFGIDYSNAVSTIADGATSPSSFGAPPILVNNTAYVPVDIFRIIQGNNPAALQITDTEIILKTI